MVSSLQAAPSPNILPPIDILIHLLAETAQIELYSLFPQTAWGELCVSKSETDWLR